MWAREGLLRKVYSHMEGRVKVAAHRALESQAAVGSLLLMQ